MICRNMTSLRTLIPVFTVLLGCPAQAADSLYTDLKLDACKKLSDPSDEESCCEWRCAGIKGNGIMVMEGDLRMFVAYGPEARQQCAALQTMSAFNTLGPKVEWRVEDGKPFATILRWFTDNGSGTKKNWLVVTKLDGDQGCHTAYIDGAMPDANGLARKMADSVTRRFDCKIGLATVISKQPMTPDEIAGPAPCGPGPYREQ